MFWINTTKTKKKNKKKKFLKYDTLSQTDKKLAQYYINKQEVNLNSINISFIKKIY